MDEFGVLTERYGLKPQGKAAPMAAAKRPSNATNSQTLNYGVTSASNPKSSSNSTWNTNSGSYKEQKFGDLGDYGLFGGSTKQSVGSSFDYDSVFNPSAKYDNDDIFGLKNSAGNSNTDVFASFPPPPPPPQQSSPVVDLLGGYHHTNDDIFGGIGTKLNPPTRNGSVRAVNKSAGFDVLIPGFGESTPSVNVYANQNQKSSSRSTLEKDPFEIFQSVDPSPSLFSDPLDVFSQFPTSVKDGGNKVKSPEVSSIDELEKFAKGIGKKNIIDPPTASAYSVKRPVQKEKPSKYKEDNSPRSMSVPKLRTASSVSTKEVRNAGQRVPRDIPLGMKKASSETNIVNDLADIFVFGESEDDNVDRLRGRLAREAKTKQRMAQAVAEMNQRDFQTQQEQEERRRIAETLDIEIKRWAAGKEGNMRALLSSLQYVLWSDCGWEPVSLTDLITSGSVKKVYRRAALFVHPDKVQQKGATVEQKYTAEKVFDVLKEAWKKFESEELR